MMQKCVRQRSSLQQPSPFTNNSAALVIKPRNDSRMHHLLLPECSRPTGLTTLSSSKTQDDDSKLRNDQGCTIHSSNWSAKHKQPSLIQQLRNELKSELNQMAGTQRPNHSTSSPVSAHQFPIALTKRLEPLTCDHDEPVLDLAASRPSLDSDFRLTGTKRVTFAAELNLRRRSARQYLLCLTVNEIDALGRLEGTDQQQQQQRQHVGEHSTKPLLVGILRTKKISIDDLRAEIKKVRIAIVKERFDCNIQRNLIGELEQEIASVTNQIRAQEQQSCLTKSNSFEMLCSSIEEIKKKRRKYNRKIAILQATSQQIRSESNKLKGILANFFAPLTKACHEKIS